MALIKCKNCGKEISDKAIRCPKCGTDFSNEIIENNKEDNKIKVEFLESNKIDSVEQKSKNKDKNGSIKENGKQYIIFAVLFLMLLVVMIQNIKLSNRINGLEENKMRINGEKLPEEHDVEETESESIVEETTLESNLETEDENAPTEQVFAEESEQEAKKDENSVKDGFNIGDTVYDGDGVKIVYEGRQFTDKYVLLTFLYENNCGNSIQMYLENDAVDGMMGNVGYWGCEVTSGNKGRSDIKIKNELLDNSKPNHVLNCTFRIINSENYSNQISEMPDVNFIF